MRVLEERGQITRRVVYIIFPFFSKSLLYREVGGNLCVYSSLDYHCVSSIFCGSHIISPSRLGLANRGRAVGDWHQSLVRANAVNPDNPHHS